MLKKLSSGVCAGILISIGGAAYLKCDNKYVGAVLFTVALLCICYKSYSLYTGKICYILEKHDKEYLSVLFLGLLGNIIATFVLGIALRFTDTSIFETASSLCESKLTQTWYSTVLKGILCGILIYLAVDIFAKKNTPIGIIFCIPTFILCGFEHSIADIFYFSVGGKFTINTLVFIFLVIIGNSLGGILLPLFESNRKMVQNEK